MSSTGTPPPLRQRLKSAVFGDSCSHNRKDQLTGEKQASQVQKSIFAVHPETRPYIKAFIPHWV